MAKKKGDTINGYEVIDVMSDGKLVVEPVKPPEPSLYEKLVRIGAEAGGIIKPDSFYERLTAFVEENFVPKAEAKRTISPENLERLMEAIYLGENPGGEDVWELHKASPGYCYKRIRNEALAELNCDVAPADVDFVVSGKDGKRLEATNEKARDYWHVALEKWQGYNYMERRTVITNIYESGHTIRLDPKGGHHEQDC